MNVCKLTIPPPSERATRTSSTSTGASADPCGTEPVTAPTIAPEAATNGGDDSTETVHAETCERGATAGRLAAIRRRAVRLYLAG
jgi:hypothetical protein